MTTRWVVINDNDGTGNVFVLCGQHDTLQSAERAVAWMRIGQGQHDSHSILTRQELSTLRKVGKIRQGCWTDEAFKKLLEEFYL